MENEINLQQNTLPQSTPTTSSQESVRKDMSPFKVRLIGIIMIAFFLFFSISFYVLIMKQKTQLQDKLISNNPEQTKPEQTKPLLQQVTPIPVTIQNAADLDTATSSLDLIDESVVNQATSLFSDELNRLSK